VLLFDEATHTYTVAGVRLPSVTQIIAPIREDFAGIPPAVLEAKRQLGTAVHLACELDDLGELDEPETDPEVMAYVQAWRSFRRCLDVEILANEQRLHHPALRYAGTIDRFVNMATRTKGGQALWVLDLKTAAEAHESYGPQTAAYSELLRVAGHYPLSAETPRRGTVHLRSDGTYRLHEFKNPNDEAAFRACLAIHNWKEANK
jgi:hypothetical protein